MVICFDTVTHEAFSNRHRCKLIISAEQEFNGAVESETDLKSEMVDNRQDNKKNSNFGVKNPTQLRTRD